MIIVRNLSYGEVTFAQLWGQSCEPDSGMYRFLSVYFNLHIMLPSGFVKSIEPHLLFAGLVEFCFPSITGTLAAHIPSFGSYKSCDGKAPFSPSASQLRSVIRLVLPHWPKIGPSSSSRHRIFVFLWCEIVSRARLGWIKCSASGRVGLLTDLWMALPSFLSLQRTGPDEGMTGVPGQVGLRGTDPASCCLLTELFMLWEYYIGLKGFLQLWFTCDLLSKRMWSGLQ